MQLQPDSLAETIADLYRRVQVLESTARVGLNRIRYAWTTGATFSPNTFGAYEDGAAPGNTYMDDLGVGGAGYPQLTVETGSKVLILMNAMLSGVAFNAAVWRTNECYVGVGRDGGTPSVWTDPRMYRQYYNNNAGDVRAPIGFSVTRMDLTPGTHQFGIWAQWQDVVPAGAKPQMLEASLAVIPID